jgi:cytochrome c peroxidase
MKPPVDGDMLRRSAAGLLLCLLAGVEARAGALDAQAVRALIDARVGGIAKLRVPASDADLPQPRLESGEIDPYFRITEAKRYLGKLLFHDPIRSNNIKTEFGGNPATSQTASCGSCHLGEAQSKAGQVMNFGVGGEGRMEMDARGGFRLTRRIIPDMVDIIPTPQTLKDGEGNLILEGHFDEVDSVPRLSPTMVGFAFNNRLLGGGAAGEPYDPANPAKLNKNPNNFPAGENLAQIAFKVHRMVSTQQFALQENAVYRELFADAFPEEYALYLQSGELNDFINELTVIRAVAAFLRTVITRDTPWDRFLAGDDDALTERQLRGAVLFASPVSNGGADCISCHSGPALNKQLGDEEGVLVEENFFNIGIGDHPLRELSRTALQDPNHHDPGRLEVTAVPSDFQKFKTPTLRQLEGGGQFMHSGELTSVRQVIEYFDAGIPASAVAVQAGNITPRFTNPRGPGLTGLGLSGEDMDALEDFLVNALHDPAFARHDPSSPTRTFDPNIEDLTYSAELKALGARDGLLPSLMAVGNDDAMTRDETIYVRGRVTGDANVNIADAIFILNYLLAGGNEPHPMVAADTNHDGKIDIADPVYLLRFLFYEGLPLAMPYPDEGSLMP